MGIVNVLLDLDYDDGFFVGFVLAISYLVAFEFMVWVGLVWVISGVSKSNALRYYYAETAE